jgi:hypothetical protein
MPDRDGVRPPAELIQARDQSRRIRTEYQLVFGVKSMVLILA